MVKWTNKLRGTFRFDGHYYSTSNPSLPVVDINISTKGTNIAHRLAIRKTKKINSDIEICGSISIQLGLPLGE